MDFFLLSSFEKFENYVLLLSLMDSSTDVVNGIKRNDITLTFQKSDVMSAGKLHNSKISNSRYCQRGGKQHDIILKFEKSHVVNRCCQWRKATRHNSQS